MSGGAAVSSPAQNNRVPSPFSPGRKRAEVQARKPAAVKEEAAKQPRLAANKGSAPAAEDVNAAQLNDYLMQYRLARVANKPVPLHVAYAGARSPQAEHDSSMAAVRGEIVAGLRQATGLNEDLLGDRYVKEQELIAAQARLPHLRFHDMPIAVDMRGGLDAYAEQILAARDAALDGDSPYVVWINGDEQFGKHWVPVAAQRDADGNLQWSVMDTAAEIGGRPVSRALIPFLEDLFRDDRVSLRVWNPDPADPGAPHGMQDNATNGCGVIGHLMLKRLNDAVKYRQTHPQFPLCADDVMAKFVEDWMTFTPQEQHRSAIEGRGELLEALAARPDLQPRRPEGLPPQLPPVPTHRPPPLPVRRPPPLPVPAVALPKLPEGAEYSTHLARALVNLRPHGGDAFVALLALRDAVGAIGQISEPNAAMDRVLRKMPLPSKRELAATLDNPQMRAVLSALLDPRIAGSLPAGHPVRTAMIGVAIELDSLYRMLGLLPVPAPQGAALEGVARVPAAVRMAFDIDVDQEGTVHITRGAAPATVQAAMQARIHEMNEKPAISEVQARQSGRDHQFDMSTNAGQVLAYLTHEDTMDTIAAAAMRADDPLFPRVNGQVQWPEGETRYNVSVSPQKDGGHVVDCDWRIDSPNGGLVHLKWQCVVSPTGEVTIPSAPEYEYALAHTSPAKASRPSASRVARPPTGRAGRADAKAKGREKLAYFDVGTNLRALAKPYSTAHHAESLVARMRLAVEKNFDTIPLELAPKKVGPDNSRLLELRKSKTREYVKSHLETMTREQLLALSDNLKLARIRLNAQRNSVAPSPQRSFAAAVVHEVKDFVNPLPEMTRTRAAAQANRDEPYLDVITEAVESRLAFEFMHLDLPRKRGEHHEGLLRSSADLLARRQKKADCNAIAQTLGMLRATGAVTRDHVESVLRDAHPRNLAAIADEANTQEGLRTEMPAIARDILADRRQRFADAAQQLMQDLAGDAAIAPLTLTQQIIELAGHYDASLPEQIGSEDEIAAPSRIARDLRQEAVAGRIAMLALGGDTLAEPTLRKLKDALSTLGIDHMRIAQAIRQRLPMAIPVAMPVAAIPVAMPVAPPVEPNAPQSSFFDSPGFQYTSWGTDASVGSLVGEGLRRATGSRFGRWLGNKIQDGHTSGPRYWAGAAIKGLASVTGAAASLVGGTVSFGEVIVANIGEALVRAVRGPKALAGHSFLTKGKQTVLSADNEALVAEADDLALLARITGSTTPEIRTMDLPAGFERVADVDEARDVRVRRSGNRRDTDRTPTLVLEDHVPLELLSRETLREEFGDNEADRRPNVGSITKLRYSKKDKCFVSDGWSALMMGVYTKMERDSFGQQVPVYYLSFTGTQAGRPATLKSNVVQAFGAEDSAYEEARLIVEAFKQKHGAGRVHVIGHSLGGGLATWAGINAGVRVTGFNSAGLHINLRNRLGASRINEAFDSGKVRHFNTKKDPISQIGEARRFGIDASSQIGTRYLIPNSKGHSLKWHGEGLARLRSEIQAQRVVSSDAAIGNFIASADNWIPVMRQVVPQLSVGSSPRAALDKKGEDFISRYIRAWCEERPEYEQGRLSGQLLNEAATAAFTLYGELLDAAGGNNAELAPRLNAIKDKTTASLSAQAKSAVIGPQNAALIARTAESGDLLRQAFDVHVANFPNASGRDWKEVVGPDAVTFIKRYVTALCQTRGEYLREPLSQQQIEDAVNEAFRFYAELLRTESGHFDRLNESLRIASSLPMKELAPQARKEVIDNAVARMLDRDNPHSMLQIAAQRASDQYGGGAIPNEVLKSVSEGMRTWIRGRSFEMLSEILNCGRSVPEIVEALNIRLDANVRRALNEHCKARRDIDGLSIDQKQKDALHEIASRRRIDGTHLNAHESIALALREVLFKADGMPGKATEFLTAITRAIVKVNESTLEMAKYGDESFWESHSVIGGNEGTRRLMVEFVNVCVAELVPAEVMLYNAALSNAGMVQVFQAINNVMEEASVIANPPGIMVPSDEAAVAPAQAQVLFCQQIHAFLAEFIVALGRKAGVEKRQLDERVRALVSTMAPWSKLRPKLHGDLDAAARVWAKIGQPEGA